MTSKSLGIMAFGALLGVTLFTGANANARERRDEPTDESRILSTAKVSLGQAVTAAEQATGGRAAGTGIEDQNGIVHFEVTILKDKARKKVLVDTQTGQVVKIVAAADDDDDSESED